jgi:hypothetical protein
MKGEEGLFVGGSISAPRIEPTSQAPMHPFHNHLVFHFNPTKLCTGTLFQQRRLPYKGQKPNPGAPYGERFHHIDREAPGIGIDHEVREEVKIPSGHPLSRLWVSRWKFKDRVLLGKGNLDRAAFKEFESIIAGVDGTGQALVDPGEVKTLQVILHIEFPLRLHLEDLNAIGVEMKFRQWKKAEAIS